MNTQQQQEIITQEFRDFFKNHHDKILCTVNKDGQPSVSIMGTPRLTENGDIEMELSDDPSITLNNVLENKAVVLMVYEPGLRAKDYKGIRIYAEVAEILTDGEKLEMIRSKISERFGKQKAAELVATITRKIKKVRPVVDRGQLWNQPPFGEE